jgi:hypothetical protein
MCLLWSTNWGFYTPEDDILHSHRRENLKSYRLLNCFPIHIILPVPLWLCDVSSSSNRSENQIFIGWDLKDDNLSAISEPIIYTMWDLQRSATLVASTAFLSYMETMFVPHRKHIYGPQRPVTGIALLSYMETMFVPHRKHIYGPQRPVTGIASLFIYRWWSYLKGNKPIDLHSQETHLRISTVCYRDSFTFLYVDYVRASQEDTYGPPRPITGTMKKREKWVVVRDITGKGHRIYHRFWRFPGIARLSFW